MDFNEDQLNKWSKIWRAIHPPLSWGTGVVLFIYITVADVGSQRPEWYVVIGGLMGFPLVSMWGQNRRNGDK